MSSAISFTFPAIQANDLSAVLEVEEQLAASELEFISALREKYASLASHNGYIRISDYTIGNQNWRQSGETFLERDGVRVKGLLAGDYFASPSTGEWVGSYTGQRLYLTVNGWTEIERHGSWSQWQDSSCFWSCDGTFADDKEFEIADGRIRNLSDADVASEYNVIEVASELAKSLTTLAHKLPERLTRKRALAQSLNSVTAALKG